MRAKVGECKLCLNERKLIRAHVIPNSFYGAMLEESGYSVVVATVPGVFPSKRSTGVYDPSLVCEECERRFSPWDTYAKTLLLDTSWSSVQRMEHNGELLAWVVEVDYALLKLFFLSVAWRASASTQPFFQNTNLGPHEAIFDKWFLPPIRAMLTTTTSSSQDFVDHRLRPRWRAKSSWTRRERGSMM